MSGEASTSGTAPPTGPHFLEHEWVIWEHRSPDKNSKSYEDNMAMLCEVATVEDFWKAYNNIPKPSQIFFDGRSRKRFKDRSVESFSLFKKNIKPEWEDAANRSGAEWFCRKMFPAPQLVRTPEPSSARASLHRFFFALGQGAHPPELATRARAECLPECSPSSRLAGRYVAESRPRHDRRVDRPRR